MLPAFSTLPLLFGRIYGGIEDLPRPHLVLPPSLFSQPFVEGTEAVAQLTDLVSIIEGRDYLEICGGYGVGG